MSWECTLLSDWTSAGGTPLGFLGEALAGSSIRRELGGRGSATLVLPTDPAWALARPRAIVRVDRRAVGDYREFRIMQRRRTGYGLPDGQCTITGTPRRFDLGDSDLVRETLGGRTIFRFNETLTATQYLERFVFVRQSTEGLAGVRLGTVGFTERVPLRWDRWTRGQLLEALQQAYSAEVRWWIDSDGVEVLDLVPFVGDSARTVPLAYGDRLRSHLLEEDVDPVGTVARVAGEAPTTESERATIGENVWRVVGTRTVAGGQLAVEIRAHETDESPILEAGQYVAAPALGIAGAWLEQADGVTRWPILATDATTSECTVAGTAAGLITTDERVRLVADADGAPLEVLELPSAIAAYGRVVRDVQITGGRGERQYAENGGHEDGLTGWAPVNSGVGVELLRSELGRTLSGTVQTSRGAGVSPATPWSLGGLVPLEWLRQLDQVTVVGATIATTGPAIAAPDGSITLPVAALATAIPAGTSVVFERAISAATPTLFIGAYLGAPNSLGYYNIDGRCSLLFAVGGALSAYETVLDVPSPNDFVTLTGTFQLLDVTVPGAPVLSTVSTLKCYVMRARQFFYAPLRYNDQPGGTYTAIYETGGYLPDGHYLWLVAELPPAHRLFSVAMSAQTQAVTRQRERRSATIPTLTGVGATAITLAPLTLLARALPLTGDALQLQRAVTAEMCITSAPTALYVSTFTVTIDLGLSTIQARLAAEWPSLIFRFTGDAYADADANGIYDYLGVQSIRCVVTGITGTSVTLQVLEPYTDINGDDQTWAVVLDASQTASASGTYIRALTLTSDAPTWTPSADYGSATWPVSHAAPAVTESWPADTPIIVSRAGYLTGERLRLGVTLSIGAGTTTSSLSVRSYDDAPAEIPATPTALTPTYLSGSGGGSYRAIAGSVITTPGETFIVAASVQANGSGVASVTPTAANVAAVGAGAVFSVVRPALIPPTLPPTGSVLRLGCAVGGTGDPLTATAGLAYGDRYFRVPAGSTRQIVAVALFALNVGTWLPGQGPVVALVDAAGTILGWQRLGDDGIDVAADPGLVTLAAQATISASGLYGFRVFGGSNTDASRWCLHLQTMFTMSEATDVPYTRYSWATAMMTAVLRRVPQLAAPRVADRLTVSEWSLAQAQAAGVPSVGLAPIVEGGRVHIEDTDRRARVVAITETPTEIISAIEIGQLAPDGMQFLAQTAIAAGTGGRR